jgi:hypothetical protein
VKTSILRVEYEKLKSSDYIGSRRIMEEWTSVPIGSLLHRMKQLGSHMTNTADMMEKWYHNLLAKHSVYE